MKYLFVASTGGHLAQLVRLSSGWDVADDSLWVTFETSQSLSLLAGRRVLYVPYVSPRDVPGIVRTFRVVNAALRHENFDEAVSTGAAVALGAFPAALIRRIPRRYIESVSRVDGPSLTGRIVHGLRLAETYTQHRAWARGRWHPHPPVLSRYVSAPRPGAPGGPGGRPSLFVTLGTIKPYRFDRLVDAVLATGLADHRTVWQLGETTRDGLPGRPETQIGAADFDRLASEADVVITHAGVGTMLALLEMGIHPVIVPRRSAHGEHVDDHQLQITRLAGEAGIAQAVEVESLTADVIHRAASLRTEPRGA